MNYGKITDTQARKIASEWHGGQGTALYAFASTGAIDTARADHNINQELTEAATQEMNTPLSKRGDPMGFTNLIELRTYCRRMGTRGPVEGWGKLSW